MKLFKGLVISLIVLAASILSFEVFHTNNKDVHTHNVSLGVGK